MQLVLHINHLLKRDLGAAGQLFFFEIVIMDTKTRFTMFFSKSLCLSMAEVQIKLSIQQNIHYELKLGIEVGMPYSCSLHTNYEISIISPLGNNFICGR